MRTISILFVTLLVSGPALAERDPTAEEIVRKADAATKAVGSVRYRSTVTTSGAAANFLRDLEADVFMDGWAGGIPERFHVTLETHDPRTGEPVEVAGGGDGESFFLVDHLSQKGYEDIDPGVLGSARGVLFGGGMIEFVHGTPFSDELEADTLELQGTEDVAGEPCDKIRVVYAGGQGESIWYFSQRDRLPRRRIRVLDIPQQGKGEIVITVSRLETDPEACGSMFRMSLPTGYEMVDDFAP